MYVIFNAFNHIANIAHVYKQKLIGRQFSVVDNGKKFTYLLQFYLLIVFTLQLLCKVSFYENIAELTFYLYYNKHNT